jgi:hypothetical protein
MADAPGSRPPTRVDGYLAKAEEAERLAAGTRDEGARASWQKIATAYRSLAASMTIPAIKLY